MLPHQATTVDDCTSPAHDWTGNPDSNVRRLPVKTTRADLKHIDAVALACSDQALVQKLERDFCKLGVQAQLLTRIDEIASFARESRASIAIIDVKMISLDTLEGLDALNTGSRVSVIALADDLELALDSLPLLPVDVVSSDCDLPRLKRALERAVGFSEREWHQPAAAPTHSTGPDWLIAHDGDQLVVVHFNEILALQAQAKFTRIITRSGSVMVKRGLGSIEENLQDDRFMRIHRGTIVNQEFASKLHRDKFGHMQVKLKGCEHWFDVSKPYEVRFKLP